MRSSAGWSRRWATWPRRKPAKSRAAALAASSTRAVAAGLVHRDHRVRPGEELRRHRLGNAEEAGDHDDRESARRRR